MPTKRPENTAFKQQRLKSWQPLLTPKSVIPSFFIIGLIFVPIGIVLQMASDSVKEAKFDYSQCSTAATSTMEAPKVSAQGISKWQYDSATKNCVIQFEVPERISAPVYMYYRLTNFYQNNRKYVKSFDLNQLKGQAVVPVDPICSPLDKASSATDIVVNNVNVKPTDSAVYYPCGLIANSLFSDNITALTCINADGLCGPKSSSSAVVLYPWDSSSIAWAGDASKYGKSDYLTKFSTDEDLAKNVIPPPFWRDAFPQWKNGYNQSNFPNLNTWTGFQVWMRTAGLPTFRKLWGSNNNFLAAGTWQVNITQNFDTGKYGGTKSIVLSSSGLLGGKNGFLGAAYLITGLLCLCLGVAFLVRNMVNPRKLGDHKLLSWNEAQTKKDDQSLLQQQN